MPDPVSRLTKEEIEETIDTEDHVDESSFESFPASDPPSWSPTTAERTRTRHNASKDGDADS